jgi:hypothetical protein
MTVAELIAKLLTFDGGMYVYVSAEGGQIFDVLFPGDVNVKHGDVVIEVD